MYNTDIKRSKIRSQRENCMISQVDKSRDGRRQRTTETKGKSCKQTSQNSLLLHKYHNKSVSICLHS